LGGPNKSIETLASIATRVIEVCNPPPRKGDSTRGGSLQGKLTMKTDHEEQQGELSLKHELVQH